MFIKKLPFSFRCITDGINTFRHIFCCPVLNPCARYCLLAPPYSLCDGVVRTLPNFIFASPGCSVVGVFQQRAREEDCNAGEEEGTAFPVCCFMAACLLVVLLKTIPAALFFFTSLFFCSTSRIQVALFHHLQNQPHDHHQTPQPPPLTPASTSWCLLLGGWGFRTTVPFSISSFSPCSL